MCHWPLRIIHLSACPESVALSLKSVQLCLLRGVCSLTMLKCQLKGKHLGLFVYAKSYNVTVKIRVPLRQNTLMCVSFLICFCVIRQIRSDFLLRLPWNIPCVFVMCVLFEFKSICFCVCITGACAWKHYFVLPFSFCTKVLWKKKKGIKKQCLHKMLLTCVLSVRFKKARWLMGV